MSLAAPAVERFDVVRSALDFDLGVYPDVKDPCVVYDGRQWHIYGTGCNARGEGGPLEILHAVADDVAGPWRQLAPARLDRDLGCEAAAPGVAFEDGVMHLFVQTKWSQLGGSIEHFVSADGTNFAWCDTPLSSRRRGRERGVYDVHPCVVRGERYLVYSAMAQPGRPDVFLARSRSGTWSGPWERLGCIVGHADVGCHNQLDDPDYEWGLEGGELVELPDGRILFNAVCFLHGEAPGTRQRVFMAVADDVLGPYDVLGAVFPPAGGIGENGHGSAFVDGEDVGVIFQERVGLDGHWRYAFARVHIEARTQALSLAG